MHTLVKTVLGVVAAFVALYFIMLWVFPSVPPKYVVPLPGKYSRGNGNYLIAPNGTWVALSSPLKKPVFRGGTKVSTAA